MRRADRELARSLPLFSTVGAELFHLLMRDASLLRFAQFATVIEEGRPVSFLHAVVEGAVELSSGPAGHEATLEIVHPRETFVLPAVLRNQAYRQSARVLAPARILTIPAATIRDLFNRDAGFARAVAIGLASGHDRTMAALKGLKLRSSAERLANWILETHAAQGNNGEVTLKYPKRTLASQLGMTPENLSRNLANLPKHGVSIKGRVMTIVDAEAVRRWGRREPLIEGS